MHSHWLFTIVTTVVYLAAMIYAYIICAAVRLSLLADLLKALTNESLTFDEASSGLRLSLYGALNMWRPTFIVLGLVSLAYRLPKSDVWFLPIAVTLLLTVTVFIKTVHLYITCQRAFISFPSWQANEKSRFIFQLNGEVGTLNDDKDDD